MDVENLASELAGVYRMDCKARVFPRPGLRDWNVVTNHEFTHLVLGTSTTGGQLHEILAYMAYRWPHPEAGVWRVLYQRAVALSTTAHEATATFMSLSDLTFVESRSEIYENNRIPSTYQKYFEILDDCIPQKIDKEHRKILARSLAISAFNDPLEELLMALPFEFWEGTAQAYLPAIDDRFDELVRRVSLDPARWLQPAIQAIKTLPELKVESSGSTREFLTQRRRWTGEAEKVVVEHYRREAPFPIVPSTDAALWEIYEKCLIAIKRAARSRDPKVLVDFSRTPLSNIGEDPSLYWIHVIQPPSKLSGLVRVNLNEQVPGHANIIDVMQAAADCRLTDSLILRRSQYYTRFFFISDGRLMRPIFYGITDDYPNSIKQCRSDALSITIGPLDHMMDLPLGVTQREGQFIVRWLTRLHPSDWNKIITASTEWQIGIQEWKGAREFATFVLHHVPTRTIWITASTGAAREVFQEDATMHRLTPLDSSNVILLRTVSAILLLHEHLSPSEGVPV